MEKEYKTNNTNSRATAIHLIEQGKPFILIALNEEVQGVEKTFVSTVIANRGREEDGGEQAEKQAIHLSLALLKSLNMDGIVHPLAIVQHMRDLEVEMKRLNDEAKRRGLSL